MMQKIGKNVYSK